MAQQQSPSSTQVMPSADGVNEVRPIPPAAEVPIADILPVNPRLFSENRWEEYFDRLRAEDPVRQDRMIWQQAEDLSAAVQSS